MTEGRKKRKAEKRCEKRKERRRLRAFKMKILFTCLKIKPALFFLQMP
jgi:hypothetical protein